MLLTVALTGLILIFILGSVRPVNMGAIALVVAAVLSLVIAGEPLKDLFGGFPVSLLVILVGVTYLFGLAKNNGTVDWLVHLALLAVKGKTTAIPWVIFTAATVVASIGAASPAAVAIVAPIGITFAVRYRMSPLMNGLMAVNGAAAGSFSPVGILGGITVGAAEHAGIHIDTTTLYLTTLGFNIVVGIFTVLIFRNYDRAKEPAAAPQRLAVPEAAGARISPRPAGGAGSTSSAKASGRPLSATPKATPERIVTLAGIVVMLLAVTTLQADAGVMALAVAVTLALVFPKTGKTATTEIAWGVVLLVTGIVTYISVLERLGIVKTLGGMVAAIGVPLLAAFLICLVGGVVSAFASTTGILGALVPLSMPFISSGSVSATALLSALAISSSVVDASPFSTNGALVVANVPENLQKRAYRGLLCWGLGMIVTAPVLSWAMLILIPWGL